MHVNMIGHFKVFIELFRERRRLEPFVFNVFIIDLQRGCRNFGEFGLK